MTFEKGNIPWNTGLTKETDNRLVVISQKISKANKGKISWNKGLTKETDKRIKGYKCSETKKSKIAVTLTGHTVSLKTRHKIGVGNSKVWNSKTEEEKGKLRQKNREANLGRKKHNKISREKLRIAALYQWQKHRKKMLESMQVSRNVKPNKFELAFLTLCEENGLDNIKYVGNGKFWLTVPKKYQDIQYAVNPDCIVEPFSKSKTVIELIGLYWHSAADIKLRKSIYKDLGVYCLFITDKAFYERSSYVMNKVKEFVGEVGC